MEKRATKRMYLPFIADHLAAIIGVMVVITLLLASLGYIVSNETVKACLVKAKGTADLSIPVKSGRLIGSIVVAAIALMLVASIICTAVEWKKCYGTVFKKTYIVLMTVINAVIALVGIGVTVYLCWLLSTAAGYKIEKPITQYAPAVILLFISAIHIVLCWFLYRPGFRNFANAKH